VKLKPPSPIAASDYPRVMALWQAAGLHVRPSGRDSQEAFTRQCESGLQTGIGVETEAGELIGVTLATHDGRKGWINRLAVEESCRNRGLGRRLVLEAERRLAADGMEILACLIEDGNEASMEVFGRLGYRKHPEIQYFAKRRDPDV